MMKKWISFALYFQLMVTSVFAESSGCQCKIAKAGINNSNQVSWAEVHLVFEEDSIHGKRKILEKFYGKAQTLNLEMQMLQVLRKCEERKNTYSECK